MRTPTALIAGLLALSCTAAIAQDDELLGLWASETTFAPALQGGRWTNDIVGKEIIAASR